MTYTNITCICTNVQSYIRYVTLHYITLHCITLHTYCTCICICVCVYVYIYMCMCISICMCICKSICICPVYVYLHMCICIYDLKFYKSYQKLIHSRARPCPMAAMRASRMGEAQKCMLTIWWVWLLLFPAGNHQWSSPSGPKDCMDQWIVAHSCHPTYLYISNKRSKRCSIRLLWLGMTVAIATGLFIVCEEILSRSSRDEPTSRKYWLPQQYCGLSFGSVVMRKSLKGVALWRAANFATATYLEVKSQVWTWAEKWKAKDFPGTTTRLWCIPAISPGVGIICTAPSPGMAKQKSALE